MISIKDKKECCGCSACAQRCPRQCISLEEDAEGFLYPNVDENNCINCGLCEKVCPVINQAGNRTPLDTYAAINPDDNVRMQSSSGGVFTALAEQVIDDGGVVFGACIDDQGTVYHDYVDTSHELAKFRGSKYVQSQTRDTFKQAESFLKQGRKVLYSGTPCQIAGLKRFLRKDYENLLAVDFICHGVPSPGVFRTYLRDEMQKCAAREGGGRNTVLLPCIPLVTESDGQDGKASLKVQSISFRDKRNGWKKFGFALVLSEASAEGENSVLLSYSPLNENLFLRGFLKDLYLRPSCYACPSKQLRSGSDITLGDWWGIDTLMPEIDDDRGVSAVTANTEKGCMTLASTSVKLYSLPYTELTELNPALVHSCAIPKNRARFFQDDGQTFEEKIKALTKVKLSWRMRVRSAVRRCLPEVVVRMVKGTR